MRFKYSAYQLSSFHYGTSLWVRNASLNVVAHLLDGFASCQILGDVPAHHHECVLVSHVVAVDQIPANIDTELHNDLGAFPCFHAGNVFPSRHQRGYRNFHTINEAFLSPELFEVYVDRVRPSRTTNVVVNEPPFGCAFKDAVGRMFRVEDAAKRSVKRSPDPEQSRRHRCSPGRTRWIANELPLPIVVDGRFVRILGEHGRNWRRIFREPRFSVNHVELQQNVADIQSWRQWIRGRIADDHRPIFSEVKFGTRRELGEVDDDIVAFGHAHSNRARNDRGRDAVAVRRIRARVHWNWILEQVAVSGNDDHRSN